MRAMEDELARSMDKLRLEGLDKLYFLAYQVDDAVTTETDATFGGLTQSDQYRTRTLRVEVRVGSPQLDNTNFLTAPSDPTGLGASRRSQLPLEDNYLEIRRKIWLATDAAFKDALETISRKRAALQNKTLTESLPDFAAQAPAKIFEAPPGPPPDLGRLSDLARGLSALFRSMPQVASSSVRLRCRSVYARYANSEGSRFMRATPRAEFIASARGYAPDGYPLGDFTARFATGLDGLPSREQMADSIRALGGRMADLQKGSLLATYNGPVLFEGEAAAELLAQAFLPSLAAARAPVTDNPQMEMFLEKTGNPFEDKIGARVLPAFLDLADDPTAGSYGSEPLLGVYKVDNDGVPAARTVLVEHGILKALVSTRDPAHAALKSTGNRRGASAAPSNVILSTDEGLKDKDLRRKLLALAKDRGLDYGIVIRRLGDPLLLSGDENPMASMMRAMGGGGGDQISVEPAIAAYKLYNDGHEELLRNVEVGDLSAGSFKDIAAVSRSCSAVTVPFQQTGLSAMLGRMAALMGDGGSATPLVSIVTPDLLFEELTLSKPEGEIVRPPVAGHPFFSKDEK